MVTKPTVQNDPWGPARFLGAAASNTLFGIGPAIASMFRRGNQTPVSPPPSLGPKLPGRLLPGNGPGTPIPMKPGPLDKYNKGVNRFMLPKPPAEGDGGAGYMGTGDALAQIRALMGELGMGQSVSYDPLRQQARQQWTDADARTKAMFDQLGGFISSQAAPLGAGYDTAIADTGKTTQAAIDQNVAATQALSKMEADQAQRLGIQEAVGNAQENGSNPTGDATNQVANASARGQITSNLLNTNKASALDYNNDLVGASALAGGQARNQRLNELNRLLAGYDVQEQEANAAVQGNSQQQMLEGVFKLLGINRDDIKQTDLRDYQAQQESNRWDIANLPGQSLTGKPQPMNQASARQYVLDLYGPDAFKNISTQKLAQGLYLKLQGY